ncbi:MAG: phosphotransferase [Paenibacillus sp.]|jgi:fructosamine-3-kinase|nr:phosphotransferase [Paenibacillus sp.]
MADWFTQKAERIASGFFQERVKSVVPIVGKGIVNQIAVVETTGFKAVIRMNNLTAQQEYVKERWCLEQAAAAGIPGPQVLSVGAAEEHAYMIQTFVEGDNGEDTDAPKKSVWGQIGEYAKIIHKIPAAGYGEQLFDPFRGEFKAPPHEGFDGSWISFVQYNRRSLTENDRLIELGVITASESRKADSIFEKLQQPTAGFGLNHGDLSLKNTVVNRKNSRVFLLDWGSAEVNLVPYRDLIELLQSIGNGRLDEPSFQAFLDGYGMSGHDFAELQQEMKGFQLLIAFDKLRWAIDKKADLIPSYAAYANRVAGEVLK